MDRITYRNEKKYLLSRAEAEQIRARLGGLTARDAHADAAGRYHIESLYFDDYRDSAFWDNENGVTPRQKFRLRMYGRNAESAFLELKCKENTVTCKFSQKLSAQSAREVAAGDANALLRLSQPLSNSFALQCLQKGLRPAAIVAYDREPFVYRTERVRVTFDTEICASAAVGRFLTGADGYVPVLPGDAVLMEVKYDAYLPGQIARALDIGVLQETKFSKYHICRKALTGKGE